MLILKKISIMGMLLPAPDRPPAFERAIKKNISTRPVTYILGSLQKPFSVVDVVTPGSVTNSVST